MYVHIYMDMVHGIEDLFKQIGREILIAFFCFVLYFYIYFTFCVSFFKKSIKYIIIILLLHFSVYMDGFSFVFLLSKI